MEENMRIILTPREAAQALRISTTDLYPLLDKGEIPAYRDKSTWKIPVALLQEYANNKAIEQARLRREIARKEEA